MAFVLTSCGPQSRTEIRFRLIFYSLPVDLLFASVCSFIRFRLLAFGLLLFALACFCGPEKEKALTAGCCQGFFHLLG